MDKTRKRTMKTSEQYRLLWQCSFLILYKIILRMFSCFAMGALYLMLKVHGNERATALNKDRPLVTLVIRKKKKTLNEMICTRNT